MVLCAIVHSNQSLIVQSENEESVERKHVLPHSVAFVCTGLGTPTDDKMYSITLDSLKKRNPFEINLTSI